MKDEIATVVNLLKRKGNVHVVNKIKIVNELRSLTN